MFYALTLLVHSYLRWLLLVLALWLLVRALVGSLRAGAWTPGAERLHTAFVGVVDLQFTLGLLLYLFLSPSARMIWSMPAVAMRTPALRFFGLEHALVMIIAVAVVHIGRTRAKRAGADGQRRQRTIWISTAIALLLFLAGQPWPFLRYGRPLLRTMSAAGVMELEPGEQA